MRLWHSLVLTWRLQKVAVSLVVGLTVVALAYAAYSVVQLREVAPPVACIAEWIRTGGPLGPDCPSDFSARFDRMVDIGSAGGTLLIASVPMVFGVIAGVTLVGRELEERTAQLVWMLDRSRIKWFVDRLLPTLLLIGLAGVALAVGGEELLRARTPWIAPGSSFEGYGLHGVVLLGRTAAYFAIAVFVGAVLGRQLVGALVAAGAVLGLWLILQSMMPFGQPLALLTNPPTDADLAVEARWQLADGFLGTYNEIEVRAPADVAPDLVREWVQTEASQVWLGVPGSQAGEVGAREAILLGGLTASLLIGTGVLVRTRRPS